MLRQLLTQKLKEASVINMSSILSSLNFTANNLLILSFHFYEANWLILIYYIVCVISIWTIYSNSLVLRVKKLEHNTRTKFYFKQLDIYLGFLFLKVTFIKCFFRVFLLLFLGNLPILYCYLGEVTNICFIFEAHSQNICYHRKWNHQLEFNSCTKLTEFHFALMLLGKAWIYLFSLQK